MTSLPSEDYLVSMFAKKVRTGSMISRIARSILFAAILAFPFSVQAFSDHGVSWSKVYPASASDNADCRLCHAKSTSNLNEYGEAIRVANRATIKARIILVESKNSDRASGTNLAEINAGTQPGWTDGPGNRVYDSDDGEDKGSETAPESIDRPLDIPTYTIGGTLAGLSGSVTLEDLLAGLSGSVTLQNNGTDDLVVDADGGFTFGTALLQDATYSVTVSVQPARQNCAVTNGSGTVTTSNIIDVTVSCGAIPTYTIGGTLAGLSGSVTLQNNGGDDLVRGADGGFTFGTELLSAATYSVTVTAQPAGQDCSVTNGSGTIASADISNIAVACDAEGLESQNGLNIALLTAILNKQAAGGSGFAGKIGIYEGEAQATSFSFSNTIRIDINTEQTLIDYPSLSCGGNLTLLEETPTQLLFRETLTYGFGCRPDLGFVELIEQSKNELLYQYYFPGIDSEMGALAAIGSVTRVVPTPSPVIVCEAPRPQFCTFAFDPVCGNLAAGGTKEFSSACNACADEAVASYLPGSCVND